MIRIRNMLANSGGYMDSDEVFMTAFAILFVVFVFLFVIFLGVMSGRDVKRTGIAEKVIKMETLTQKEKEYYLKHQEKIDEMIAEARERESRKSAIASKLASGGELDDEEKQFYSDYQEGIDKMVAERGGVAKEAEQVSEEKAAEGSEAPAQEEASVSVEAPFFTAALDNQIEIMTKLIPLLEKLEMEKKAGDIEKRLRALKEMKGEGITTKGIRDVTAILVENQVAEMEALLPILKALEMEDKVADVGKRLEVLKGIAQGGIDPERIQEIVATVIENQLVEAGVMNPVLKALEMETSISVHAQPVMGYPPRDSSSGRGR